jgi:FkbM family methyltransferase
MLKLRNKLAYFRDFRRHVGASATLRYHVMRKVARVSARLGLDSRAWVSRLRIRGYPHPVRMRPGTSDVHAFHQIFIAREYDCLGEVDVGGGGPVLIVDCGANVGYASVYFLNKFQQAHVIAVEADRGNFEICRQNLAPFGARATVIHSAIWSHRAALKLRKEGGRETEWGIRVEEVDPGDADMEGTSIAAILDESGFLAIDVLKIDIEGAEAAVFAGDHGWLASVKNIVIELHGENCTRSFFDAMVRYQFDLSTSGELTVCRNIHACR